MVSNDQRTASPPAAGSPLKSEVVARHRLGAVFDGHRWADELALDHQPPAGHRSSNRT